MKSAATLLFSASLIASVAAHGWIGKITIGGKAYTGNKPTIFQPTANPSVVRQIADNLPVKDVTSAELTCGRTAQPGKLVATAAPGDQVLVNWNTAADNGFWFHDVGPMMTYLASCGSGSCANFDASKAKWFKISEQGQDASGVWAFTLPSNLKAGNYLLRHEIIALHTAQSLGGAEFYPDCAQITVTGDGTGAPAPSELSSLPGAYKASDPGILIDVYNMGGKAYQFPGSPVAAFVSGGTPPPPASPPAEAGSSTAKTATHSTVKAASSTKVAAPTTSTVTKEAQSTAAAAPATASSAAPKTCKNKRSRRSVAAVSVPEAAPASRRSRSHMHRDMARARSF
ncbi:glycosyl hydrolase family 61-domain-containing protein [Roridomyces roridus]|uniref:lytic cellulose monooxygenase (C4-dehydrogenating) n=1 Tax=Roridomyces roridus TaxID=1738132 RepID=A0AAD7BI74_9AGAR|nr:glycosyl hydrolase family 61-domain-containing protein [Roridomyces roridus]